MVPWQSTTAKARSAFASSFVDPVEDRRPACPDGRRRPSFTRNEGGTHGSTGLSGRIVGDSGAPAWRADGDAAGARRATRARQSQSGPGGAESRRAGGRAAVRVDAV